MAVPCRYVSRSPTRPSILSSDAKLCLAIDPSISGADSTQKVFNIKTTLEIMFLYVL